MKRKLKIYRACDGEICVCVIDRGKIVPISLKIALHSFLDQAKYLSSMRLVEFHRCGAKSLLDIEV